MHVVVLAVGRKAVETLPSGVLIVVVEQGRSVVPPNAGDRFPGSVSVLRAESLKGSGYEVQPGDGRGFF